MFLEWLKYSQFAGVMTVCSTRLQLDAGQAGRHLVKCCCGLTAQCVVLRSYQAARRILEKEPDSPINTCASYYLLCSAG